jgi:hypothetical protein
VPIANSPADLVAGLEQSKIPVENAIQYQNDGRIEANGVYGGTFNIDCYLPGHGSTCVGAISATDVPTLLGRLLGTATATQDGGTATGSTDADTFAITGATVANGSLIRAGGLEDTRGEAQWLAVDTNVALTVELLTASDGALNASDVIYAAELVHCNEGTTAPDVSPSLRFNIQTANQRYGCWGCFLGGAPTFSGFNAGEIPMVSLPISVSQWEVESASTYPTTTSVDNFVPAVVAAGSFFIQEHGTTTRNKIAVRDVEFSLDYQVQPLFGPGSEDANTIIIGARRLKCQPTLAFTMDAEAAGTQTYADAWSGTTYYHILYSMSVTDGSAMGLYLPKAKLVGMKPTQIEGDGLNRVRVEFQGVMDLAAGTTELERSAWRMGFG